MNFTVITEQQYETLINKIDMVLTAMTAKQVEPCKLLEVGEAAKTLRVSQKTLRSYIECGRITAVNLNKGTDLRPIYKIEESEIKRFIKARRTS